MRPQINSLPRQQVGQRIVFLLTNDFRFDSRVRKLSQAAKEFGFDTHVVCYVSEETKNQRYLKEKEGLIHRVGEVFLGLEKESLWKNTLWFFPYIFLYGNPKNNKYIYENTLEIKPQIIWANDASTLLIGVKLKNKLKAKLIYDSHELWSEFPKVYHRNFKRVILKIYALFYSWFIYWVERLYIRYADAVVTVNNKIAQILQKQYRLPARPTVITNAYPYYKDLQTDKRKFRNKYKIPQNSTVLAYSGYLGSGRAVPTMLETLLYLPDNFYLFALVPETEIAKLHNLANDLDIAERVITQKFVKYESIAPLLANCDLGLLFLEKSSKNLIYALPNKFFEYIQAGLPMVSGPHTVTINSIISKYNIGIITQSLNPELIAKDIQNVFNSKSNYLGLKKNIERIKLDISWENEKNKLIRILTGYQER